ncbi:MAG TPA: hypothetical protein VGN23_10395 [Verrucomicrobiae bacterium]
MFQKVAWVFIAFFLPVSAVKAQSVTNIPVGVPVEFYDVPLDVAIQALLREADINYIIDPRLCQWWERSPADGGTGQAPIENFRAMNTTPQDALKRILAEHHLVLLEDSQTGIARVTYPRQTIPSLDPDLCRIMANKSLTNQLSQPEPIQFTDVPLDVALQALAREAGINYLLNPRIGWGRPDHNGDIRQPPTLTLRWNRVTPAQGLIALCENYGLVIYKIPKMDFAYISPRDWQIKNFVDASVLGADTNAFIPVQIMGNSVWQGSACSDTNIIDIENATFQSAFKNLADCAGINVVIHADLPDVAPISFYAYHITPKQAIIVLCDLYGLTITKDPTTGEIEIGPRISRSNGVPLVTTENKG